MTFRTDLTSICKRYIAEELARHGIRVFPIKAGTKDRPLTRWGKGGPGECATTDLRTIKAWWERWPRANIGIATEPSGLVVLDVDVKDDKRGDISLMVLDLNYAECPPTLTVLTPSGGFHLYYRTKTPVPSRTNLLKDEIGAGLDVRSLGGYVVGPGSNIGTKGYRIKDPEQTIADAPPALLDVIRRHPGRAGSDPSAPGLAPASPPGRFTPEQLDELLEALDPTDFRDHDSWFHLMCACHYATGGQGREEFVRWSTSDPMYRNHDAVIRTRWDSLNHTRYPGAPVTERTLMKLVREAGGSVPGESPKDDFEALPSPPAPSTRFLTLEQIRRMPPTAWLIDGFIPEGSLCILYGTPGSFKTFLALHGGICIANGTPFFGRRVRQGAVFYLAGESPAGFRLRTAAWEKQYGPCHEGIPFYLQPGGAVINGEGEVAKLARDIFAVSDSPKLIVIDTLQVYLEGNENSPEHMGAFVRACLQLKDKTGAAVLVLHHLGKDVQKGARGHTSLAGTADAMFEMVKKNALGMLRCTKMKEADDQFSMVLEPIRVVVDPKGEFTDSLVLAEADVTFDTETTTIHALASQRDGQGVKVLVDAVQQALGLSASTARRKIKEAIPGDETEAVEFDGGRLWLAPDPNNPQGAKTIRYQREEREAGDEDYLA